MTTQITKKEQNANYYQKKKSHVVSIRLTESTMARFKELEEESNLGKSQLVRAILAKAEIKKPNPKEGRPGIMRNLRKSHLLL